MPPEYLSALNPEFPAARGCFLVMLGIEALEVLRMIRVEFRLFWCVSLARCYFTRLAATLAVYGMFQENPTTRTNTGSPSIHP